MPVSLASGQEALSANPRRPAAYFPGFFGKRVSGVPLSLLRASCPSPFGPASLFALLLQRSGDFLSGKREKVTRPPQEDESSCSR